MPHHRRLPVVLYVPNLLGYTRIGLAIVGLQYATSTTTTTTASSPQQQPQPPPSPVAAVAIWLAATSLDLLDGWAARALRQTSRFGSLLDIVADNILRTSIWIAAAVTAADAAVAVADNKELAGITTTTVWGPWVSWTLALFGSVANVPTVACVVICLEWMTMVSTQIPLFASNNSTAVGQEHWKAARRNDPWIVQAFFRHNFCNMWGAFGMFGLFSANLFCYASHHAILYHNIPCFYTLRAIAFAGRLFAAYIELWLCRSFLSMVLEGDERNRQGVPEMANKS
jgi:CDP-alcohol phosphatidyltransferase